MKTSQLILVALVAAVAAYFVHGYLDNNLDKHPEMRA
jgi:hypothetical protein